METLLLDTAAVEEAAALEDLVPAVETAFGAYERGDAQMPPKAYIDLPQYNGDFRSMPAYLDAGEWDATAVKWVNAHPDNPPKHDLPTVMGTVVYSDPATAVPLAVMDGSALTGLRTGAAAAVATRYLAVDDATTLGIVGAGAQAYTQLEAIATVRPIERVVVADRSTEAQRTFVDAFDDRFEVVAGSIAEAGHCDVLSTVTPVREPIVPREAVGEQTHVNAMGADAAGKHELADAVLTDARIVIDDYDQCVHSGEINVPFKAGTLDDDDISATLGALVEGTEPGRRPTDGITVFDSTGLAIQDVAAAHSVYEHATDRGLGDPYTLLDV